MNKPCPFCGANPVFPEPEDVYGTFYEWECDCGIPSFSIQISDLMTIEERMDSMKYSAPHKYADKYINRARDEVIKEWERRYDTPH